MESIVVPRRLAVSALLVGISGCVGSDGRNQATGVINDTERITSDQLDATRSTLGYVKFVEKPQDDVVEVRQTIVDVSLECGVHRLAVSPEAEEDTITVSVKRRENAPATTCKKELPVETGTRLRFTELNEGYTIEFTYTDLSIVYETVGELNTLVAEPYEVPDGVRI